MFASEAELVEFSLPLIMEKFKTENNDIEYVQEPKGLFGIPDVIIFNGKIVAIEYKLKNWKQAMKQAYRYQSFSDQTYVILDAAYINLAKNNIDMFIKFNIGLGAVDNNDVKFYYKPIYKKPFSNKLSKKALELFY